jgi:signal transduction histidine kinase
MIVRSLKTFPWFELALVVALGLIGWVTFTLYEIRTEGDETRTRFEGLQKGFTQIAIFVPPAVEELTGSLTQYVKNKDKAALQKYQRKSLDWQQWLVRLQQRWSQVPSEAEAESSSLERSTFATNQPPRLQNKLVLMLAQIQSDYSNYTNAAHYLIENAGAPLIRGRLAQREAEVESARLSLLAVAEKARVYGELTQAILLVPHQPLGELEERFRHLRFALLLALVGLSFLLMWVIYRGQLARTRQIIAQHKQQHLQQQTNLDKLAHFGRLAQELAHEIKQPLTAMGARVYTLQKLLPPGSDTLKDTAVIRGEIKRLDQIVKDFLELARPTEPRLIPVTAERTLKEIQELMRPELEPQAITLKCECSNDVQMLADVHQLKQVLINLVKNAAESFEADDAARDGGTITLRARQANRELRGAATDVAVIEVADTGSGIPPEIQKRIFDPFFSTKADGTGLGLAIASEIVDKHRGSLEFDSEPGKGTVFRILLPVHRNGKPNEKSPPDRR